MGIFDQCFSKSATESPRAPVSAPDLDLNGKTPVENGDVGPFFSVYHTFKEGKQEAWWSNMAEADMPALIAKNRAAGFHLHSFMPADVAGPINCLWECKPGTTAEQFQAFIDGPEGPGEGVFENKCYEAQPGAMLPASGLAAAVSPSPPVTSSGAFFWVYHTFVEGKAAEFWESMKTMDMDKFHERSHQLGFHCHSFVPGGTEGPCICIWESRRHDVSLEEFQTFIDSEDGPGPGMFINTVHKALPGAHLLSAYFEHGRATDDGVPQFVAPPLAPEEQFCMDMYGNFKTGNIQGIIDAGKEGAFMDSTCMASCVPYAGRWSGPEQMGQFFEKIGASWGGPKGIAVAFEPHSFSTAADGTLRNKVVVRQLTPGGNVILGVETHTWTGVDVHSRTWGSMTVSFDDGEDFHAKAFDGKTSQAELLCKMCWTLFGEGKTDHLIATTQHKDAVFTLLGDAEDASKVPYAGKYTKADMKKPFEAMTQSWKMDETFKFAPTSFRADGNTVTMEAEIDCTVTCPSGKPLKGTETHTAVVKANEDGVLQIISWDVTNGSHHIAAFC